MKTNELWVLPFDHRASFQEKLFGIRGRAPDEEESRRIAFYKWIVYQGFQKAIEAGIPAAKAGILVDEQFGIAVLQDARRRGYRTACPVEKSGQDEFDFEYGTDFAQHVERVNPAIVKVLVRYNPEADGAMNERQAKRLRLLSDYCRTSNRSFMFELLVPATQGQLESVGGEVQTYDRQIRPRLMVQAMRELQEAGVEPNIWKLEGLETELDCRRVVQQARSVRGGKDVGVIVLGRGESAEKVKQWLAVAAQVPGLIGFAVGRTIFWEPLKGVKEGRHSAETAAAQIAANFKMFCDLWSSARSARPQRSEREDMPRGGIERKAGGL